MVSPHRLCACFFILALYKLCTYLPTYLRTYLLTYLFTYLLICSFSVVHLLRIKIITKINVANTQFTESYYGHFLSELALSVATVILSA